MISKQLEEKIKAKAREEHGISYGAYAFSLGAEWALTDPEILKEAKLVSQEKYDEALTASHMLRLDDANSHQRESAIDAKAIKLLQSELKTAKEEIERLKKDAVKTIEELKEEINILQSRIESYEADY